MNKKPIYTDFLNAQWKPAPMFYGFKPNVRPYILPHNRGKLPMPKSGHIQFGEVAALDKAEFNPLPNKPELQLPGKIFNIVPAPQAKFLNAATVKLINSGKVKAVFKNMQKVNPLSMPMISQMANSNLKLISLEMVKNAIVGLKYDPELGTEQQQLRARTSYDNLIICYASLVDRKQDNPINVNKIINQYEKEMVEIYGPGIRKPVAEEILNATLAEIKDLDSKLVRLYEMITNHTIGDPEIEIKEGDDPPTPPPEEEEELPPEEEELPPTPPPEEEDLPPAPEEEDILPPEEEYLPPPPEEPPEYKPPESLNKLYEILTGTPAPAEITSVVFLNKLLNKSTGSNKIDDIIKDYQFVKNGVPLSRVFKDSLKPDKDIGDLINAIMQHKMGWGTDTNMGQKNVISKIYNRLAKAHNYAYGSNIPTIKKGKKGASLTKENLPDKINDIFIMTNALITYDKKLLESAKVSKKPKPITPLSLPPGSADVPPPPPKKKPKPPKPTSLPPSLKLGEKTGKEKMEALAKGGPPIAKPPVGLKEKLAAEEPDEPDIPTKPPLNPPAIAKLINQLAKDTLVRKLIDIFAETDDPLNSLNKFFSALYKLPSSDDKAITVGNTIDNLNKTGKKLGISVVKPPYASDAYDDENIGNLIIATTKEAVKLLKKQQGGPGRKRKSRKRPTMKSVKKLSADVNNQILRLLKS